MSGLLFNRAKLSGSLKNMPTYNFVVDFEGSEIVSGITYAEDLEEARQKILDELQDGLSVQEKKADKD